MTGGKPSIARELPHLSRNDVDDPSLHHARRNFRVGDWVFINAPTGDENGKNGEPAWFREQRGYTKHDQPFELFNLNTDPQQKTNRLADELGRVNEMRATLARFIDSGRSTPKRTSP